jgi:two-component system, OmpR family, sensor histidine kinase KdpD
MRSGTPHHKQIAPDTAEPVREPVLSPAPESAFGHVSPDPARIQPTRKKWRLYGYSSLIVLLTTLLGLPFRSFIEPTNLVMLYLAAVMWVAVRWGRFPAIWASILCTIVFDLVFVPPYYTFIVDDAQYILTFLGLLGVGIIISALVAQVREQEKAARWRERQTVALYDLSQKLTGAADLQQIADAAVSQISRTTGSPVAIFFVRQGALQLWAKTASLVLEAEAVATAVWVQQQGRPADRESKVSELQSHYLPLTAARGVMGVLLIDPGSREQPWTEEERRLLTSFAGHIGLAVERALLAEETKQIQLMRETEKLHTTLLNSISHDLRTPLASITGVLSSLREDMLLLPEAARSELVNTAWEETERLNRLVGNLLDMTRLESGTMQVTHQPADLEDLVGVALEQMSSRLKERPIHTDLPPNLPLVRIDFVLMVQVLVNLLDNAVKYSPSGTPIRISLRDGPEEIIIAVSNEGNRIPEEELDKLFEKFYRVNTWGGTAGTGLGLSISRGIVEVHNGRIWAENRAEGGLTVSVALPKDAPTNGREIR